MIRAMMYRPRAVNSIMFVLALLISDAARGEIPAQHVPPVVNFTPGVEYGDEVRMFQGIPSLERAPGGRLWAVWYTGGPSEDRFNYIVGVTSADNGNTWSQVKFVIDPDGDEVVRAYDPSMWVDPLGRLWVFWAQRGEEDPVLFAMSCDNPDSENPDWTKPRMIADGIMMCKPTLLADGTWLLPTALWMREGSTRIVESRDNGRTFALRGTATVENPKDRAFDEPMLVERNNRSLWLLVRTSYGIGEAFSHDGGRTWTQVTPSKIPHPSARFFIRRLKSGNLLLVKHGPLDRQSRRELLTAYLSEDDGLTWTGGLVLDERLGVSYPDGAESKDGAIFVIYDFNRVDDKNIHLARFTEEDVRAGKLVSSRAGLRILVNTANGLNPLMLLQSNADGAPLLDGPRAELETENGEVRPVGGRIFSDRPYVFYTHWNADIPDTLRTRRFIHAPMGETAAVCKKDGTVYVITPSEAYNQTHLNAELVDAGFVKARVPEFLLFFANPNLGYANICSVYQKTARAGERISFGKWGVLLF